MIFVGSVDASNAVDRQRGLLDGLGKSEEDEVNEASTKKMMDLMKQHGIRENHSIKPGKAP